MQRVIPLEHNGEFVAQMEHILDAYKFPYDPLRPLICTDESSQQLIRATRSPRPAEPGMSLDNSVFPVAWRALGLMNDEVSA